MDTWQEYNFFFFLFKIEHLALAQSTVWQKPNTANHFKSINLKVKHGGGSIMLLQCSSVGTGKLVRVEDKLNTAKIFSA